MEPLVALIQESPIDRLLPTVVDRLKTGLDLKSLAGAAALANARALGGGDYVGYHAMMAIGPALKMAALSPANRKPLPLLKVVHRGGTRIHDSGAAKRDALQPTESALAPEGPDRA